MIWSKRFFADSKRARVINLALYKAALLRIQTSKVPEHRGHIKMMRPQGPLDHGKATLKQKLSIAVACLGLIECAQTRDGGTDVRVVRPEYFFVSRDAALVETLSVE